MDSDPRNRPPVNSNGPPRSPPATPNHQLQQQLHSDSPNGLKRKRSPNESPLGSEPVAKLVRPDAPEEAVTLEDAMTCSICMGEWTNSGVHRVVSLECGHLFGRSCIERWLTPVEKGIVKKCPTCGTKGKLRDLRNIYPIAVVAVDSDQVERLKHEVAVERGKREQKERELDQARVSLAMIRAERDRYESELRDLRMRQAPRPEALPLASGSQPRPSQQPPTNPSQDWTPSQRRLRARYTWTCLPAHQIPLRGTYRHLAAYPDGDQLALSLATGPDAHTVVLYSVAATATQMPTNPVHVHSKPIKQLAVSPRGLNAPYSAYPHVLTAGLDARACLMRDTRVVTTFTLPCPAWACAFDPTDGFRVWVGGADTGVYGYDLRMPARPWTRLDVTETLGVRGPGVHSVVHLPGPSDGGGTLVAATMKGAVVWTGLRGGTPAAYAGAAGYAAAYPPPTQPVPAAPAPTGVRVAYPPTVECRQCFAVEPVHAPADVPASVAYALRQGSNPLCATTSTLEPWPAGAGAPTWTWPVRLAQCFSPARLMTRMAAWQWAADEPPFMVVSNEALTKLDVYAGHRHVTDLVPVGARAPLLDLKVLGGGVAGQAWAGVNEGRAVVAGINEAGTLFMFRQDRVEEGADEEQELGG